MSEFTTGFRWNEDEPDAKFGAGISRPMTGRSTKLYKLTIKKPASPTMIVTLPAESKRAAIKYAKNRWPAATVEAV